MEDLSKEKADDIGHTIRMMAELLNTLRKTELVLTFNTIARLTDSEHTELKEAIRLIRGLLNNP